MFVTRTEYLELGVVESFRSLGVTLFFAFDEGGVGKKLKMLLGRKKRLPRFEGQNLERESESSCKLVRAGKEEGGGVSFTT